MNEETNNEMDLLLRRLGRRPDRSVSDANGDVEHLDADELNAYAENVLPAAARARYTEHLAECARCRELVVQLSSSAGVVPVAETVKASEPSALRKFLASLFSPLVMRYAVPVLGVIVVAAIGFSVLRQRKGGNGSIAQLTEGLKATSTVTPNASDQSTHTVDSITQEKPAAVKSQNGSLPADQTTAAAPQPAGPAAGGGGEASRDALAKKEEPQQPVTTDAPAAAAPKPTPTPEAEQQAKSVPREEAAQDRAAKEPPADTDKVSVAGKVEDRKTAELKPGARSEPSANATPGSFSALTSVPPGTAAAGARSRNAKESEREDKNKDDSNTTTVAGRHFRKRGGVWIDTAYNSSSNPTNVTRGSEQYRALIADEPGIKTIADQLDGEILVVWKGRPYRIR